MVHVADGFVKWINGSTLLQRGWILLNSNLGILMQTKHRQRNICRRSVDINGRQIEVMAGTHIVNTSKSDALDHSKTILRMGDLREMGLVDQENAEEIITVWHNVQGWVYVLLCERDSSDLKLKSGAISGDFMDETNESQANSNTMDEIMQPVEWILVAQLLNVDCWHENQIVR